MDFVDDSQRVTLFLTYCEIQAIFVQTNSWPHRSTFAKKHHWTKLNTHSYQSFKTPSFDFLQNEQNCLLTYIRFMMA